jgi:hypothetical protein
MHSRISRVIYGARDPKTGVHGSVVDLFGVERLNHHATVEEGCWLMSAAPCCLPSLPVGAKSNEDSCFGG